MLDVHALSAVYPSPNHLITPNQMLLRTCVLRSKPCFAVRSPSLVYRGLPAHASSRLRFTSRPALLASYATSTGPSTSSKSNGLPLDASKLSDPGSGNKDSFEQQQIPQDSLIQESTSKQSTTNDIQPPSTSVTRENIYTIPNALTVSRIISCPFLGYFIINGNFVYATSLLFYAGVSDLVSLVALSNTK